MVNWKIGGITVKIGVFEATTGKFADLKDYIVPFGGGSAKFLSWVTPKQGICSRQILAPCA